LSVNMSNIDILTLLINECFARYTSASVNHVQDHSDRDWR